jgi:hypothetical protein
MATAMSPNNPEQATRLLRHGRRFGLGLYAALVVIPVAIWAGQIMEQVWAPEGEPSHVGCRAGIAALVAAVQRARLAAGSELGGERPALERFRETLNPEWRWRTDLGRRCRADQGAARALETVDLYRYAEEHALRYEARDVAHLRRRIQNLQTTLFGGPE